MIDRDRILSFNPICKAPTKVVHKGALSVALQELRLRPCDGDTRKKGVERLPMPTIFSDANIFLDSYRRTDKSYRTLLRSLKELSSYLLLTNTVLSEIERNRVSVYMDANKIEKNG